MLIVQDGEIATREEIKKKLWPNDTVVEFDHSINAAIKKLRRALDDSAEDPQFIQTVARRGYRLIVPVEWVEPAAALDSCEEESAGAASAGGSPANARSGGIFTGKTVSHYRVLDVIGGGGMGLVYKAEDLKLGRAVALKFLPEDLSDQPKALERFEREARAVSSLSHPNICPIYEFDEYEGHPFIVMELLQGKTLREHIAAGALRLSESAGLDVAIQIAAGLEAAHEKGIIHRDIKPANIFITDKNVAKILDFGVAKVLEVVEPEVGKGRGFSRAVAASISDEGGNQSPSGLIPSQDQISSLDGAPKGAPFHGSELKPDSDNDAQRQAEARLYHAKETTLTLAGSAMGTAGYMSPEQVRGEQLDARTDIFLLRPGALRDGHGRARF